MAGGSSPSRSLEETPSWAVATVCFIIVSVSIIIERSIHFLSEWLRKNRKSALYDAVGKLKSELMRLGFLSLLLAVFQSFISNICIPYDAANTMLPCSKDATNINAIDSCSSRGKVSLVTQKGILQLQIFIFVLAVMQIVHSVLSLAFGRAKMRRWKAWEQETRTLEYQIENDPNRFRFTRQTTFGRRHSACTQTSVQLWTKCFLRQFFHSVAKVDYLTLRHGFITAHFSTMISNFNFQAYIERSLDEDFKVVVSISPLMWFIVVIFMLVDVHGWHSYLWISYIPLLIVLVLGTKLEVIVEKMALSLKTRDNVTIGTPMVQPNDDLFWFRRPRLVLNLLHLALFVNAFEIAFFIWVTVQFGLTSCYHEHIGVLIARITTAVTVQILCSYITLPLYALVTQMGSKFNSKIMNERTAQILRQWYVDVREKRKEKERNHHHHHVQIATSPRIDPLPISYNINPPTSTSGESASSKLEIIEENTEQSSEIIEEASAL